MAGRSRLSEAWGMVGDGHQSYLGGGFRHFLFSSLPGEMIHFDEHIFQMGWFNHQLVIVGVLYPL